MRAAERGQKVVGCDFVCEIDDGDLGAPLVTIAVENVVVPHGQVE